MKFVIGCFFVSTIWSSETSSSSDSPIVEVLPFGVESSDYSDSDLDSDDDMYNESEEDRFQVSHPDLSDVDDIGASHNFGSDRTYFSKMSQFSCSPSFCSHARTFTRKETNPLVPGNSSGSFSSSSFDLETLDTDEGGSSMSNGFGSALSEGSSAPSHSLSKRLLPPYKNQSRFFRMKRLPFSYEGKIEAIRPSREALSLSGSFDFGNFKQLVPQLPADKTDSLFIRKKYLEQNGRKATNRKNHLTPEEVYQERFVPQAPPHSVLKNFRRF